MPSNVDLINMKRKINISDILTDIPILLAIEICLFKFFGLDYFTQKTTYISGDYPIHYYTAHKLRFDFLAKGWINGWTNDILCGYPLFQMYFPLPFLIISFLSYIIPFELAFRLTTVLGTFLLPISCYLFFIFYKVSRLAPLLSAISSLLFLFIPYNGGHRFWGGNIASTLIGEFCFSFSFAVFIILAGLLYKGVKENRFLITCSILEAIVGLSHGYTLIAIGLWSLFFLITYKNFIRNLIYLLKMHLLAIVIMAWWLLPLLFYSQWTSPRTIDLSREGWLFNEMLEYSAVIGTTIFLIYLGLYFLKNKQRYKKKLNYFLYPLYIFILGVSMSFIASSLDLVGIRFLPFSQIAVLLVAVIGISLIIRKVKFRWKVIILLLFLTLWLMDKHSHALHGWVKWAQSGLENKKYWHDLNNLITYLKNSKDTGRIVEDLSSIQDDSGSPYWLSLLPTISDRKILCSINLQSSLSSLFCAELQSSISQSHRVPFKGTSLSGFHLPLAVKRAKLLNVTNFIITDTRSESKFNENSNFTLQVEFGPYKLYKLSNYQSNYVEPLQYEPIPLETKRWRLFAYRWFQNITLIDYPFVFSEKFTKEDLQNFKYHPYSYESRKPLISSDNATNKKIITSLKPEIIKASAIPITEKTEITEEILDNEIWIRTTNPKVPLLIKVSYHPNWKVIGADKIYRVSPSFMLIFPKDELVRLYYSDGFINILGKLLSLLSICILLLYVLTKYVLIKLPLFIKIKPYLLGESINHYQNNLKNLLLKLINSNILNKLGFSLLLIVFLVFFVAIFYRIISGREDIKYGTQGSKQLLKEGIEEYNKSKPNYSLAREYFQKLIDDFPNDGIVDKSMYYLAMTYFYQENLPKSLEVFFKLIEMFPESIWVSKAWVEVADILKLLNYDEKIIEGIYKMLIDIYPESEVSETVRKEFQVEYSIGIYTGIEPFKLSAPAHITNPVLTAANVTDISADFVADPFMVYENNTWYMFFEVMNASTLHGDIGLATSNDGVHWSYKQIVLDEPFHLSYPYVFKWDGQYYMIPETSHTSSIRLYKATNFPFQWSLYKVLVTGKYYEDSSILRYNNKWWLFTSVSSNTLYLYYADDLEGPWKEHPKSPVIKENAHIARPAGRVITINNKIIRFAQDDKPRYGIQVWAFEIDTLTTSDYHEQLIGNTPILTASGTGWNSNGMHQIDLHKVGEKLWMACVDGYKVKLRYKRQ